MQQGLMNHMVFHLRKVVTVDPVISAINSFWNDRCIHQRSELLQTKQRISIFAGNRTGINTCSDQYALTGFWHYKYRLMIFLLLGLTVELKRPGAKDSKSTISGSWCQKKVTSEKEVHKLSVLLGFVSIDMTRPLSCTCMLSTPNTVHQNDEECSHSYEWNIQSSDLTLPNDDFDQEQDCASKSCEFTANTGVKHRQILWSWHVCIV